jgi:hypothetical protein
MTATKSPRLVVGNEQLSDDHFFRHDEITERIGPRLWRITGPDFQDQKREELGLADREVAGRLNTM